VLEKAVVFVVIGRKQWLEFFGEEDSLAIYTMKPGEMPSQKLALSSLI
jgi:hypothetical protein